MTTLQRLANWYTHQCDGEWEHLGGVRIESCDNPGWWVKINLKGTGLETLTFDPKSENVEAQRIQLGPRWLDCRIVDGVWNGAGDETRLEEIIELFLAWVEQNDK